MSTVAAGEALDSVVVVWRLVSRVVNVVGDAADEEVIVLCNEPERSTSDVLGIQPVLDPE